MSTFTVHTLDTAPADSKPLLEKAAASFGGMLPNLYGVMAESPALLEAYQALAVIFDKSSFDIAEKNIVWLTINYANGCTYCMAAHTAIAQHSGLSETDIEALRTDAPLADTRHQALRQFTKHMVEARGWADEQELDSLLAAGYTQQTALDVVLAIGAKTLSNYTNHIAATPVDKPFEKYAWSK